MKRKITVSSDFHTLSQRSMCYQTVIAIISTLFIYSCSFFGTAKDDHGSFNYTRSRNWTKMTAPVGMVRIPSGSFMSGAVDQDIVNKDQDNKRITVSEFFMHETEVTNVQYRKFLEMLTERAQNLPSQDLSTEPEEDPNPTGGVVEPEQEPDTDDTDGLNPLDARLYLEIKQNPDFIATLLPDPDVWRNDFTNSMADTYLEDYFDSPAFDDYPVVGVTWDNANLYAEFQTLYLNEYRDKKGQPPYPSFVLPSAAQWEYAARGGKELAKYPWGGPYVRDAHGHLRANFKSASGNYSECGHSYTSPVKAFDPNDYGLYDMAGNVAEWTRSSKNQVAIRDTWDLDPVYMDDKEPMKIIKGGSWKDISRFLQTGSEDYEHKDKARSFIGFRLVIPSIGQ